MDKEDDVKKMDGEEEQGFDTGYTGKVPEKKEPTAEEKKAAEEAEAKRKTEEEAEAKRKTEEEAVKSATITLTKDQFDLLMGNIEDSKKLKKTLDSLTGTVGILRQETEGLKKTITPIEISDEDFAEFTKEFPETAVATKKAMQNVVKRLVGTAPPSSTSKEELQKLIFAAVVEKEADALDDEHPDWRQTVGTQLTDAERAKLPFRVWLGQQGKAYAEKVANTNSASVLGRAISRFQKTEKDTADKDKAEKDKADKKAAEDKKKTEEQAARDARLRGAVKPRGDGGGSGAQSRKGDTEDDGFDEGWKEYSSPRH